MAYNDNSINRDVILNYALSTYGTEPEYPWENSPDNAVCGIRCRANGTQ